MGFIEDIAKYIQEIAPKYNIKIYSPIISQAVLESNSGQSELGKNAHNYFGLKYNPSQPNRCPTHNGYYTKVGSEQNADGSYTSSTMLWQKFNNMEDCVTGYFDFLKYSSRYDNLKDCTTPREYLETIKKDGYCTSLQYVDNCMNVIKKYDLEKYDKKGAETKMSYKVAIDAGHGSNTNGKRTPSGYREHYFNTMVSYYLEKILTKNGIEVYKSSWNDSNYNDDTDIPLGTRQKNIKNAKCDISVSIHANAHGNGSTYTAANGIETYYHSNNSLSGDSAKLANAVHGEIIKGTKQTNRGVKRSAFAMVNCNAMGTKASILIEAAFMTNKNEEELLKSDAFQQETAREVAQGIFNYFGINGNVGTSTSQPTPSTPSSSVIIAPMNIVKGNSAQFSQIIKNIKTALNTDYGLKFTIDSNVDDILMANLGNVVLSTTTAKPNITYAIEQLLSWWGYTVTVDGNYDTITKSVISTFQKQVGITVTGTTTKNTWNKLLGR